MKKYLKWLGNSLSVVALLAMALLVFFSIGSKISPDGVPKLADYKLMVVLSGSMSPVFEAGDVIIDSGVKGDAKKGDVITFKDPEDAKRIVTHRVIEVVKKDKQVSYQTKGDANKTPDAKLVPQGNLIGLYKIHIPKVGYAIEFAKTKQGMVWLILVPGVLIILGELRSIGKAITDEIEKKKREVEAAAWKE